MQRGPRRAHELRLGKEGVAELARRLGESGGGPSAQLRRQRGDAQLLFRLRRFGVQVHAVARFHPRGRRRGAPAVHAGGAPEHEGAHDVEALLREEQARAVGVKERPEVRPVVEAPPLVDPPLEEEDPPAPADELAGDGRPAGSGAHHRDVGVGEHRHGAAGSIAPRAP